jgi:hypothetical protein
MISSSSEQPWLLGIRQSLLAPPVRCDFMQLADLWQYDEITVTCAPQPLLEDFPDLSYRVRSAWFRMLHHRWSVPRRLDPFGRASAWDFLYKFDPVQDHGFNLARPVCVHSWIEEGKLHARIRLFGMAGFYRLEAEDALVHALAEGIALKMGSRRRIRFAPNVPVVSRCSNINIAIDHKITGFIFRLHSPAIVRSNGRLSKEPTSLLKSACQRVLDLAAWMGCCVEIDRSVIDQLVARVECHFVKLGEINWTRYSSNKGDTPLPVDALVGEFTVTGDVLPLLHFLLPGQTYGVGSAIAMGYGCYEVIPY